MAVESMGDAMSKGSDQIGGKIKDGEAGVAVYTS